MAQLSSRYAAAIFDLSIERSTLSENLDQALLLRDVLSEDDCQSIINHPRVSAKEKRSFFSDVFSEHISEEMLGFLYLATDKNRTSFILPVLSSFIDMANQRIKKTTALVVSAVPLDAGQISDLTLLLSKKINKQVVIAQKVDPSVIGGLYIQVDGYFIDRTIKTRLREIKVSLSEGDSK